MNDLSDLAQLSVIEGRSWRMNALTARQDAAQSNNQFTLTYDGYSNGQHWGKLANGGRMPVTPISPGTIRRGELFIGVGSASGAVLANWMP